MAHPFEIPDTSDWLNTPVSLLAPVENSLRCQVCKDFFNTPMITSCSHTFCSLCIRRCLSSEGKCPTCRRADQELKLRRNWAAQEVVDAFVNARPSILDFARSSQRVRSTDENDIEQHIPKRRKIEHPNDDAREEASPSPALSPVLEGRQTRSQSRRIDQRAQDSTPTLTQENKNDEGGALVPCPICGQLKRNEAMWAHIDTCTGKSSSPKQILNSSTWPISRNAHSRLTETTHSLLSRLPTLNYPLLKDTVLRKKLRDLGIPDWGPRDLLQRRHVEWVNLWNANCDSQCPKPMPQLLHELDDWERSQGGHSFTSSTSRIMRKDFDAAAWPTAHDDDFKRLIVRAQKSKETTILPAISGAEKQDDTIPDEPDEVLGHDMRNETEAATTDMRKPEGLVNSPDANSVESKAQTGQGTADYQAVNVLPDSASSPCVLSR